MLWFILAVGSAFSKSASQILTKQLKDVGTLQLAAYSHIFSALIILPLFGWIEIPTSQAFWIPTLLSTIMNVVAILLLIHAIKISELSYSIPFLSLTPVFAIAVAHLARGEEISLLSSTGILLIVFGAFTIDTSSLKDVLQFGGKRVFRDKGVQYIIIVALIYSISSVCDKSATVASSPLTYVWIFTYTRAIIFAIMLIWQYRNASSLHTKLKLNTFSILFFIGAIYFLEAIFQMLAFNHGNVAETIGVKRLSILFTSISGFVMFKEKFSFSKTVGALALVLGSIVIYLFR